MTINESEPGETLDCQKPLQWWKVRSANYKYLSKLAKKILCHTATSVPSERIFSTAGNVVSQKRSCLSPKNINCLVFLYENMQWLVSWVSLVLYTILCSVVKL